MSRIKIAGKLAESGELDRAFSIIEKELEENPNNAEALVTGSYIMHAAKKHGIAYHLAKRCTELAPRLYEGWLNYGRVCDQLFMFNEAERAIKTALVLAKTDDQRGEIQMNLSCVYLNNGRWKEAEDFARKALALKESNKAHANLGMALLAQHKWDKAWEEYSYSLGTSARRWNQYNNEPRWDGKPVNTLCIYGEQGVGDEISFASMIHDAMKDANKIIIDCDYKLSKLFRRSFPSASVYGTRWNNELSWKEEDRNIDASISSCELGRFYRTKESDFTGDPYLIADPERVLMWSALWREKRKPVIGIAWSGGVQWTGAKFRKWRIEELNPLFESIDAHWVSLQYKDASKEISGTPIFQYPHATLTDDYDDVAGLVASVDLVICMQTAVAHLAGALGKECWVFVPEISQWRYGTDVMPWYKSLKIFRQKGGKWPFEQASQLLYKRYADNGKLQRAAA